MRARHFRPMFDSLDSRIVLSDTGTIVTGGMGLGAALSNAATGSNDPGGNTSSVCDTVVSTVGWYLPGTPPNTPYDPTSPTTGGTDLSLDPPNGLVILRSTLGEISIHWNRCVQNDAGSHGWLLLFYGVNTPPIRSRRLYFQAFFHFG